MKIEERLNLHHGDVQWDLPSCQAMKESLLAARGTAATIAVKTWTGSWTTSSRMHEPFLLPCLFGCPEPAEDTIKQYLQCNRLWHLVHNFLVRKDLSTSYLCACCLNGATVGASQLFRNRFCISAVRKNDFFPLLFAFTLYHGLKLQSREVVLNHLQRQSLGEVESLCEAHMRSCLSLLVG